MSREPKIWKCSYFRDPEGLEKLDPNDIFLGEVWAGTEGIAVIYVRNDDIGGMRDLQWTTTKPDLEIEGPKQLLKKEVGKITFKWQPSFDIESALKAQIQVIGTIVIE